MTTPTEQNILKGCGQNYDRINPTLTLHYICKRNYLCPECKKLLEGYQLAQKETAEKVEKLKEEWRAKVRRMKIMSDEVSIYELECLLDKIFKEKTE